MDKRTVFAFLLIGGILLVTQSKWYKESVLGIKHQSETEQVTPVQTDDIKPEVVESVPSSTPDKITNENIQKKEISRDAKFPIQPNNNIVGEDVIIETDLYKGVLSTKGATVKSWELKKYYRDLNKQQYVELIKNEGYGNLGIQFPMASDTLRTYDYIFSTDKKNITLSEENPSAQMICELQLSDNQKLRKIFTFHNDKYSFDLDVELVQLSNIIEEKKFSLVWLSGLNNTEENVVEDMRNTKAYVYYAGETEELKVADKKGQKKSTPELEGRFDWVALRTKYFASIIFPKTDDDIQVQLKGETESFGPKKSDILKTFSSKLTYKIPEAEAVDYEQKFEIYLGPLSYSIVKQYHSGFDKIMGYGPAIIRPFAKLTVTVFQFLHKYIPNYGVVLIIFSILVKLVVYPLTRKSYVSMREMQKVQPLMAELKEKYGNDPQRMNKEMMKLYKEHGVNPMSGCLPNLLQMPLLWSIFLVFRNTIQLRHAAFFGWINDLSSPDVIHLPFSLPLIGNGLSVLPIIMGATIFFQQKMTVTDPKQKAMVYFMPFMLMFVFYRFPAGLNLYYAIFNILSMLQQRMVHTTHEVEATT